MLEILALEAETFAPFGTLLTFDYARSRLVNEGTARRADTAALFDQAPAARPVVAFYRAEAQTSPLRLTLFERHPHSAQSFLSIGVPRFLVVVAPDRDGRPDVALARAFVGRAGTGISYRRNQWHMPVMALGAGGDLVMLMAEHGNADDCIEHRLDAPLLIRFSHLVDSEGSIHGA